MADPAFAFFLLTAALLAVGVACLRLRRVERELARLRREGRAQRREPAAAPTGRRPAEELGERELRALFWSPLSVILVQCGLARETGDPERRIAIIEKHACRLRDLLEMQRLPAPGAVREERPMDPAEAIRAAVKVHADLALQRGVTVHVMPEETPPLLVSPMLLAHALRHLVRAAIEAARPGTGDVTVATGLLPLHGEPTHVAFAVAADGPGIDAAARLADPASPPTPAREAAVQGVGLSHAIVDAVALALRAEFTVDSVPGEGTRATLKVPLVPARTDRAPEEGQPATPARPSAADRTTVSVGATSLDRAPAPGRPAPRATARA